MAGAGGCWAAMSRHPPSAGSRPVLPLPPATVTWQGHRHCHQHCGQLHSAASVTPLPLPPHPGLEPVWVGPALASVPTQRPPPLLSCPLGHWGVAQGGTWVTGSGSAERRRPGHQGPRRPRGHCNARMESAGRRAGYRRLTWSHGLCGAGTVRHQPASRGAGT